MIKKLSIIIPCYNEKDTILEIVDRINKVNLINGIEKEIIIVDDYSTDGTRELLENIDVQKVLFNKSNHGKGYSLKKGIKHATGDVIVVQDADLEYNPQDYNALLEPMLKDKRQVVYGSRERNAENRKHSGVIFYLGAQVVTKATNILYGSKLTDQPTCYKAFHKDVLEDIDLEEERFGFCSEVTAKVLKNKVEIHEVPISYNPRTKAEGKKISWKDGMRAIYVLLKYRFKKRP